MEPHQLLTAPSAQSSTPLFHHTEMGLRLFGSCVTNTPRNCIKRVSLQFLFSHSTVCVFWEFSNNVFPRRQQWILCVQGWQREQCPGQGSVTEPESQRWYKWSPRGQERRDLALPFCEATVLHNHAYGQHWINISQTSPYLPARASLRTTNLFPAERTSSWTQKIVGWII